MQTMEVEKIQLEAEDVFGKMSFHLQNNLCKVLSNAHTPSSDSPDICAMLCLYRVFLFAPPSLKRRLSF